MVDAATIFAWFVMTVLFLAVVAIIVALGSLPKWIARKRNHPQIDAINAASWLGLLLGGVGWFIAFVWAFVRSGPIGSPDAPPGNPDETEALRNRVLELEAQLPHQPEK